MNKPTVHDIAREAGVSLATVDRVLNERPGVRGATVERVREAIHRIGYIRDVAAANLARRREYRFAFVLPEEPAPFVETLATAIRDGVAALTRDRVSAKILSAPAHDPHAVAGVLSQIDPSGIDGVAVMSPETPQVRDAVAGLKRAGLAVVTLVSDLPNSERDHFVGVDNMAAGRTAAVLMGRFLGGAPGRVLVVASSMLSRDNIERRLGFDDMMAERFPNLSIAPTVESHDDPGRMRRVVRAAADTPGLTGVYSMASGDFALREALGDAGLLGRVVVIAHNLTPATRALLEAGDVDAVITQNAGHLARSALRVLRAKCDGEGIFEAQERIRIEIVIRENLP